MYIFVCVYEYIEKKCMQDKYYIDRYIYIGKL